MQRLENSCQRRRDKNRIKGKVIYVVREKCRSLYYRSCNFTLDQCQKQEDVKWHFQVDEEKIFCLINRNSPSIREKVVLRALKFWLLFVILLVTIALIFEKKNVTLVCHRFLHLP